jgi:hypothetical protein
MIMDPLPPIGDIAEVTGMLISIIINTYDGSVQRVEVREDRTAVDHNR